MNKITVVPKHIGIIMDGNRRWAKAQGLPTLEGHAQGQEVLRKVARHAFNQGVSFVSAYTFSIENWQRTQKEVSYLMSLVHRALRKYMNEFHEAGIKIIVLGTKGGRLDKKVIAAIEEAEQKTRLNTKGTLALCFNYGGQQEIVDATKNIIASGLPAAEVTTEVLSANMYAPEVPPMDFIIRTSGEQRLSNFMLWRAPYSELYFVKKLWPAFTEEDLDIALTEYANRQRRFGH